MSQKEKFCKEYEAANINERLYRILKGCLMYPSATRPYIIYYECYKSTLKVHGEIHFQVAKRIVRYIKDMIDYGTRFCQVKNFTLHVYSDNN